MGALNLVDIVFIVILLACAIPFIALLWVGAWKLFTEGTDHEIDPPDRNPNRR